MNTQLHLRGGKLMLRCLAFLIILRAAVFAAPARLTPGVIPPGVVTGTLKVTIVDERGTIVPARAWVEDAAQQRWFRPVAPSTCSPYQPDRSFSCDGTFEILAPTGGVVVHVEKGKEFLPVNQPLELKPEEVRELTVRLARWVNLPARGFFSADLHVHFGSDQPAVLRQLSLADDIHVLPAFSYWLRGTEAMWPESWPAGEVVTTIDPTHVVTRSNLEIERISRKEELGAASGAAFLFNLRRPLAMGRVDEHFPDTASLCLEARRASPECVIDTDKPSWPESVIGAALGAYDVVQVCHNHYHRFATLPGGWGMMAPLAPDEKDLREPDELFHRTNTQYYHWLNCGIRLGVSGGSAMGVMAEPAGFSRTYAHIEGPLTAAGFWAATKAGRTFATSGPMLTLTADGHGMGASLERRSTDATPLGLSAQLDALGPIQSVELIENGFVLHAETFPAVDANHPWSRRIEWTARPKRSGWYAARAIFLGGDGRLRQAHTSPIYVRVDGKPITFKASADYMLRWVDRLIALAQTPERFAQSADRDAVLATYRKARDYYAAVREAAVNHWGD